MIPDNISQSDLEEALRLVQGGEVGSIKNSSDKSPARLLLDEAYGLQNILNRPGSDKVEPRLTRECSRFISTVVQLCNDTEAGYICPDDFNRKAPGYQQKIRELRGEVEQYEANMSAAREHSKPVNGVIRRIDEVTKSACEGSAVEATLVAGEVPLPCTNQAEIVNQKLTRMGNDCSRAILGGFAPTDLCTESAVDALVEALRRISAKELKSSHIAKEPLNTSQPVVVELDLRIAMDATGHECIAC
ncbi:hypothetical protein Pmar_PMAR006098 [Perkinsus marinus ATCC 50983]|uniref:Uncharacterized protein n=1 Tax=Perkinsus marinus (strain ATCC 50983 / TXsc) TaxID=423536 RepID=C5LA76_PERM5|nr:hypothetical protein Pmar_PMAR006098 [Perkinsus marinus ATCC 50983]EER06332.1 hypothetical protein Pmar_PMAR006098 [Perkinsus marinus ATCC 50983]|eukprot:XP_002774516.1 hypothetical protein Pmar_PMAR006098 [Perkinsus marinus ATCC 50983]